LLPRFAGFLLLLAIFVTASTLTPDVAHAVKHELVAPDHGNGRTNLGHGDDDQPTITPPPSRRTSVQVSEPEGHGATGGSTRYANLNVVRRLYVSSRNFVLRLVRFVP
jgi:hypothetical protein